MVKIDLAATSKDTVEKTNLAQATSAQAPLEFSAKRRCQGATRYGQPCGLWAAAGGDFCYWCERAGRPRYPLNPPADAVAGPDAAETRKQRCRGVTVFGAPCSYFAAGDGGLCLWCQGVGKRGASGANG